MFGNLDQVSASTSMTSSTSVGQDDCKNDLSVMNDQARNKPKYIFKNINGWRGVCRDGWEWWMLYS